MLMLGASMVPAWVALPLAAMTMLIVAGHVRSVQASTVLGPRRRRVRMANGVLMMAVVALLAYALGVADTVDTPLAHPGKTKAFVIVWTVIVALLGIVVVAAIGDAWATARAGLRARREMRADLREAVVADVRSQAGARGRG